MPTRSRLLSFEWIGEDKLLEIHADREGLVYLRSIIDGMLAADKPDHVHLMTPEWGGSELSCEQQNPAGVTINHVRVMVWPD